MPYRGLCSALSITVGVLGSLGCCCPGRIAVPIARPPVVIQPAPINLPPQQPAQDVQQFISKNLGPNDRAGALAPASPLWATLRQKVQQRQFKTNEVLGGGFGHRDFSETHPDGGVLIGFFAGEDEGNVVSYLQPIFLTAQGEKVGQAYGSVRRPIQCLKAKPGYALGSVTVRTGGVMDAFAAYFMKVEGERLVPGDNYTSPGVGGQGGGPGSFTTSGGLLVGIHGKRLDHDAIAPVGAITGLGFYSLP
jgi:hypothetical protein